LPFVQILGDEVVAEEDVGDLTMLLKYAFINDRATGDLLSGGLVLTVPTGASFLPKGLPDIHPVLLQPFLGFIWNSGDLYVHGFSSLVVPPDSRDLTIWFNSVGVGYFAYRTPDGDALLSAGVPPLETHLTTPLTPRGSLSEPIGGIDILTFTGGARFG